MTPVFVAVNPSDASAAGEARRVVSRVATDAGLNETASGKAAIIATELATNLARHTAGGEIIIQPVGINGQKSIEILSIDRGPGIADVERCLRDGYSTTGTPGTGLGAVRRLASEFDVHSALTTGTVVYSRVLDSETRNGKSPPFRWGSVSKPAPHETLCGDGWSVAERPDELAIIVADGLGHGPEAAKAAREAIDVFAVDPFAPLSTIIQKANMRLSGLRGAALAVVHIDRRNQSLKFVGVGNIAGHLRVLGEQKGRGLCSHNGTVGVQLRKVQEFDYPCPGEGLLVLHSDGLQTRWELDAYDGLTQRHPGVAAAVLYRDFIRGKDDVTVVVVRLSLN